MEQFCSNNLGVQTRTKGVGEMHLVTVMQILPLLKCLAATQLLCLTDVTHAQCQPTLLSNRDGNHASSVTLACRPVLLLSRGRTDARRQWRELRPPPGVRAYQAGTTQKRCRPAPNHVGQAAWLHDPTEDGDVESNPGPETPKKSPNVSNPGRLSSVLTLIKRLFGGAPTPEPQDGKSETQGTPPPNPRANEAEYYEYYITLGKTTLHDWQPNPHNRGVLHRGTTYQDMAAAMARKELYQHILATQPWNVDLS